ncbi:MAG: radical SAM protein [Bacteroidales bacterium]|nr:radical SAM protein [Bacteroidales bacterium]
MGCWNEETWDIDESLTIDNDEVIERTLNYLDSYGFKKDLTLLGGEPFSPYNLQDLNYILSKIKEVRPDTRILAWSGYEFHVLKRSPRMRKVIEMVDVLICGKFINEYKCEDTTKMYGSENQYIVDVKASLSTNTTVYLEKGNCFQNLEQLFNDAKYSKKKN